MQLNLPKICLTLQQLWLTKQLLRGLLILALCYTLHPTQQTGQTLHYFDLFGYGKINLYKLLVSEVPCWTAKLEFSRPSPSRTFFIQAPSFFPGSNSDELASFGEVNIFQCLKTWTKMTWIMHGLGGKRRLLSVIHMWYWERISKVCLFSKTQNHFEHSCNWYHSWCEHQRSAVW